MIWISRGNVSSDFLTERNDFFRKASFVCIIKLSHFNFMLS